MSLIQEFLPKVESENLNNEQIIDFLRGFSSSDILPPAHAVCIRKFLWCDALVIWFRSMLWGQTYISSVSNYGPWNHTYIKLFHIKQQQATEPIISSPRSSISRPSNTP